MFGEWCTVLVYEWWTCSSSVGVCIQLSCGHSHWWYWGYFLLEIKARYLRMRLSTRECVGKWASLFVHASERERETVCASSIVCHSGYGVSLPFRPLPSSHTHALSCTHSNMHTLSHVQKEACSIFKHFIFYCANSVCFTLGLKQNLPHHDNRYSCWNKISQMLSWFHSMNSLQNTWAATPNEQSGTNGVVGHTWKCYERANESATTTKNNVLFLKRVVGGKGDVNMTLKKLSMNKHAMHDVKNCTRYWWQCKRYECW